MERRKEEAEVMVRLDYVDKLAHITVHAWTSMAHKMERLYGRSLDGDSESSRRWRVPLRLISFRRPAKEGSKRGGFPRKTTV